MNRIVSLIPVEAYLSTDDVVLLYKIMLNRTPAPAEIAAQLTATNRWQDLLNAIACSDEYLRLRQLDDTAGDDRPQYVNFWREDIGHLTAAEGTLSIDNEAIVGRDGHLFLVRGSNSVMDQYAHDFRLPPRWRDEWSTVMRARKDAAAELGVRLVTIIVPDKISVYGDLLPGGLKLEASTPAQILAATEGICFPIEALHDRESPSYLRTDTHLTDAGNRRLATSVLELLELPNDFPLFDLEGSAAYLGSGDLGQRFRPRIVELMPSLNSWGAARVVQDNWPQAQLLKRHIGTRRVLRNDRAPDARTIVVFGDSYAFPQQNYRGLAWHLAQHFYETHFLWVPFGWDPAYVHAVGAQLVVLETAERFAARVPATEVDIEMLTGTLTRDAQQASL